MLYRKIAEVIPSKPYTYDILDMEKQFDKTEFDGGVCGIAGLAMVFINE